MAADDASVTTVHRFDALEGGITEAGSWVGWLADDANRIALAERLHALVSPSGILSLDVFDTLVIRDDVSELSRFVEIGARMADIVRMHRPTHRLTALDAFVARDLGTKASYRASTPVDGVREGSLTEIHRTASRILTGSDVYADAFIDAELRYEAGRLSPNPFLLDYANQHRARGGRVLLLSDMYMHAEQIAALLHAVGVSDDRYDTLISSADTKLSKASGGVFAIAEERLGVGPGDICHVGDSLHGDFRQPKARGWRALHLPVPDSRIRARRADHIATLARLREHGLDSDIAVPG